MHDETPVDLREPARGATLRIDAPAGGEALAGVARAVAQGLDALTAEVTERILAEIPPYTQGTVPGDDLHASVLHNLEAILIGLVAGRGPTADELAVRRELGTRRALQGLPVDAMIRAYHVGYRELWRALVTAVPADDESAARQLLDGATLVWRWVHEVTDTIAVAHGATVRSLEARAVGARQRFVELLVTGDVDGTEAARLATTVGLDPGGAFVVTAVSGVAGDLDAVDVQRQLEARAGHHAVVVRGSTLFVVSQEGRDAEVVATCRTAFPGATIAVGATREGLRGARDSLVDAGRTLPVTPVTGTQRFEDVWLWATLAAEDARLAPLLAAGSACAAANPHLAEAVTSFADAGFSVSEASRRLSLHANTVAYRLDRWQELTGWDPRSFAGLVRSLAALRELR